MVARRRTFPILPFIIGGIIMTIMVIFLIGMIVTSVIWSAWQSSSQGTSKHLAEASRTRYSREIPLSAPSVHAAASLEERLQGRAWNVDGLAHTVFNPDGTVSCGGDQGKWRVLDRDTIGLDFRNGYVHEWTWDFNSDGSAAITARRTHNEYQYGRYVERTVKSTYSAIPVR